MGQPKKAPNIVKWQIDFYGPIRGPVEPPGMNAIDFVKACTATGTPTETLSKEAAAKVTADDHAEFERVQRFILAELEHCTLSHVGINARQVSNSGEADPGDTLSISIAEYDIE